MNEVLSNTPRPSGWEPSWWEKLWEWLFTYLPGQIQVTLVKTGTWTADIWSEYQAWIVLTVVVLALVKLTLMTLRRRERNIQKLWRFVLFFLSKRQMMIPLVYRLADQGGVLEQKTLTQLLQIRNTCRDLTLRKSPTERLAQERQVSTILYAYFSKLEQAGQIKPGTKFARVAQELEYIDQKLVELQQVYNREAALWNQKRTLFPLNILGTLFRFQKFEPFAASEKEKPTAKS